MISKNLKTVITALLCVLSLLCYTQTQAASDGMIRLKSPHSASVTIDKLEKVLKAKGMTIFKRLSHTAGAKKVGLTLRPTEQLIFGNPKVGTPLMQCAQEAAIDLPQKALAYTDANGQTWLAYNDPKYIAKRHGIKGCEKVIAKISGALAKFSSAAIKP